VSRRNELRILAALLVVLAAALYWNFRPGAADGSGAPEAVSVQPLRVPDPALHLDRLARIREMEYGGTHRNIFSATPAPPPPSKAAQLKKAQMVQRAVPAFYGMAVDPKTGRKLAFFTSGDHVYIATEGETLLGRFSLTEIGSNTVQFREISSGRTAVLTMTPPVTQ
jgi:hypothetical protein